MTTLPFLKRCSLKMNLMAKETREGYNGDLGTTSKSKILHLT